MPESYSLAAIVAANIRAYAGAQRISQRAMGRAIGMSQGSVTKRWSGTIDWTLDEVGAVAEVLGVPVQELIKEPDTLNPRQWITPTGAAARSKGLEPPTF